MADIRINALATTATTPASDDYLALDGTAQGTRKILATNIANNVTDVILGTSGPSVKSSLSARAPRQGLVFDGAQTTTTVANIPAFGTSAWTVSAWINVAANKNFNGLFGTASNGGLWVYTNASGGLFAGIRPNADGFANFVDVGKTILLTITNDGTTATVYKNGVYFGNSTSVNLIGNYTNAINVIGNTTGSSDPANAAILQPLIYNRALSASEVVALYEAGDPSGADYNSASNTSIITGANSDFSSDTGYWTKGNGATISGGKANLTGGANSNIYRASLTVAGKRYRMTVTVDAADSVAYISDGNVTTLVSGTAAGFGTTGTKTFEFTVPSTSSTGIQIISTSGTLVLDNLLLYPIGLLLAPDAAQAGGGLTWYDTSGNAANITLPASGVTWNVPTSGYVTSGSSLNLSAGGTNQNITLTPSGTGSVLAHDTNAFYRNTNSGSDTATKLKVKTASNAFLAIDGGAATSGVSFGVYNSSSNPVRQSAVVGIASNTTAGSEAGYLSFFTQTGGSSLTERGRFTEIGNYLIGTTTDGGQKLQVSGTALINNGASGAAAAVNAVLRIENASNAVIQFNVPDAGAGGIYFGRSTDAYYSGLERSATNTLIRSGGATALTLDSSQNATFAGKTYTASGTAASPAHSFSGDTDSGFYSAAGNQVSLACGGAQIWNTTVNGISMALGKDIYLGNAYQAGAPTATGYLTIKDSNGNAYKIPVVAV